jgi:phosphatidylserine/phosphatidylglycerophosphate/cardiolipin synthase-like enzyme
MTAWKLHRRRSTFLAGLASLVVLLLVPSCQSLLAGSSTAAKFNPTSTPLVSAKPDAWISVYFTDPTAPSSKSYRGGPDHVLAEAIRRARVSVDVAVLQLNLWSVRDALLEVHRRGVQVRMVTDSDYLDQKEIQQLVEAGIPVLGDRREGLMHNKFLVIDRLEVWTGSMNFTISESYRNNNSLLRIRSPELAQNYTTEFEEMFIDDQFGPGSPPHTPYPELTIDGVRLRSCFSPDDGCTALLEKAIRAAHDSILFLAYSFTSDELANALLERAGQGVKIEGLMEGSQVESNSGTDLNQFLSAGLDVRLDANPDQMHEKMMLIDGKVVAVGSFNFTYSAETRNDENLLIIEDPHLAVLFLTEFERLFNQAVKASRGP